MATRKLLVGTLLVLSSGAALAQAQEETTTDRNLLTKSGEYKGYAKRDRVFVGPMSQTISPAQLHEIYGLRADAAADYSRTNIRTPKNEAGFTNKTKIDSPSVSARGFVGGDILVLGLGGSYGQSINDANSTSDETIRFRKLTPMAALSFTPNVTLGAGSEIVWADSKVEQEAGAADYNFYYHRESLGLSFHTPKMEIGIQGATYAQNTAVNRGDAIAQPSPFSFAALPTDDSRDIYLAPLATAWARGNLTDSFSMLGSVSHSQYRAKEEGAIALFNKYKREDRSAAKLQGIFWFQDRSRIIGTVFHQGAAVAPYGTEETGLGYHLANTQGGSLDLVKRFQPRAYAGLMLGYQQGERDELVKEERWAAKEQRLRAGTSVSVNF